MRFLLIVLLLATESAPTTPAEWILRARSLARAGEKAKAFEALEQAAAKGYGQSEQLLAENDFLPLREDPKWAEILAAVQKNQHPCRSAAEFRQFDYWIGEWDVERGGQKIAYSSIQLILDECVVFENYTAARGYSGKSFSMWNRTKKRWEQQYADTSGNWNLWTGNVENGVMTMLSQSPGATQRMTYTKEGPDRVRQRIEVSTDEGKTWTTGYDGLYVRRK